MKQKMTTDPPGSTSWVMTVTGALSYLVEYWRAHLEGEVTQLRYIPTILDLTSVDEIEQEFKLIHMGTESLLQQC